MSTSAIIDPAKEAAGRRAVDDVKDGMIVGLGTGSTADYALHRLGERIRNERLNITGIPTSLRTELLARELGIPTVDFNGVTHVDVTIDGADEIDRAFNMIKGGGGALLREKLVARASRLEVIVIDPSKLVEQLGVAYAVPVEVVPFGWSQTAKALHALGCESKLRVQASNQPYQTDNGNYMIDCNFPGIDDPAALEQRMNAVSGVVECGLFIGLAHRLIIGNSDGRTEILNCSVSK